MAYPVSRPQPPYLPLQRISVLDYKSVNESIAQQNSYSYVTKVQNCEGIIFNTHTERLMHIARLTLNSSSQFNSCRLEKIMDLPPSSLLGRLQAFLPEIEKANQTTQKLVEEGKLEVLDDHLEVAGTEQEKEEAEETDEEDEDDERAEQEGTATEDGSGAGAVPPRTVQLVSRERLSESPQQLW